MAKLEIRRKDGALRIGAGAGFAGDRIEPAVELVERGEIDVLAFEILAERTIALAQMRRRSGSGSSYDARLSDRIRAVLPQAMRQQVPIITNGGAADPIGAGRMLRDLAREMGQPGCRVAMVTGDDILESLDLDACAVMGTGEPLAAYRGRVVSANAYLGAALLVEALRSDPDIVVAGRTTDIALFLAPLIHVFGWAATDWARLAGGSIAGHLLECAGQLTGGYFADGVGKQVPGLARLGFPFADVAADGSATLGKVPGSGGRFDRETCLEQLLYEVEDPSAYLTPDATVDFRAVEIEDLGADRVRVSGAVGRPPPDRLKASIGLDGGFTATGAISYAGPGCVVRAKLAANILRERWAEVHRRDPAALHCSLIGLTSSTPWQGVDVPDTFDPPETRLRVAVQSFDRKVATDLAHEVEALYTNGPFGGGGVETSVKESVNIVSALVPRALVTPKIEVLG